MLYPLLRDIFGVSSICIASDSLCNNYGIVCHHIIELINNCLRKVLFISYKDPLEVYINDLKKQSVDWSKVDFHFAALPDLNSDDPPYDALIIDGASLIGLDVLKLFTKFTNKKVLITIDTSEKTLFEFLARRCQSYLICSSLETG